MPPRRKIFFFSLFFFFYYSQGKNRNEEEKCHIGRHISARVELRQLVWSESRLNWTGQWDPLCTLLSVHAAVGMLRNTIYIPTYLPSMWCTTTLISKRLCVCFFSLFFISWPTIIKHIRTKPTRRRRINVRLRPVDPSGMPESPQHLHRGGTCARRRRRLSRRIRWRWVEIKQHQNKLVFFF
jgi:hypothetical protein